MPVIPAELLALPSLQLDSLVLSLLASLMWAPIMYFCAAGAGRSETHAAAERVWMAAMALAVLPTLLTPALAAAGFSLRTAPMELPALAIASFESATRASQELQLVASPAAAFSIEKTISLLGVFYVYGAVIALLLWAVKSVAFTWKTAIARPIENPSLLGAIDAWRDRLDIRVKPRVRQSKHVSSVCVYGLFRPVIIVPEEICTRASQDDIVMMCAHELAHIKRGDTRLFGITAALRIVFWFNPFVRRMAALTELSAEQCADGLVLNRGADRRAYATCFVEGLKFAAQSGAGSFHRRHLAAAPSFVPLDRKGRRRRLDSILSNDASSPMSAYKRVALASAGAVALALAFGQAAFAVHPTPVGHDPVSLDVLPLDGKIAVAFGKERNDAAAKNRAHQGIDINGKKGAPVVAPSAGVVVEATGAYKSQPDWGKVVVIDHGNGLVTRYANLGKFVVKKGDRVWTGDKIAVVKPGKRSKKTHLHFEVIKDGEHVDPIELYGVEELAYPAPKPIPGSSNVKVWVERDKRFAPPVKPSKPAKLTEKYPSPATAPPKAVKADRPPTPTEPVVKPASPAPTIYPTRKNVVYDFKFSDGERVIEFSSDEDLTPKQRAEIEKQLTQMRLKMSQANERHQKAYDQARKQRIAVVELEAARRELQNAAHIEIANELHLAETQREILRAVEISQKDLLKMEKEIAIARDKFARQAEKDLAKRENALAALEEARKKTREQSEKTEKTGAK